MSSGSQSVGDVVVPKFDMHIYTSVLTADEVKSLVEEYAAPLDLHPCVPPSGRQAFPQRNPGGDGIGSSLRADVGLPIPFVLIWNMTTHSILNDNQLVDAVRSRNKLFDDHKVLQLVYLDCVSKEADLIEKLVAVEKEKYDLLDRSREREREREGGEREREERIKQLEADLSSKTSSLTEVEGTANTLKGNLERLTVDLSHTEIVRHNYVRQLLPTVFQRLLSSNEYKKSLSDVFNQAIIVGWSEGVKTRPERLVFWEMLVTWPLALGLIWDILYFGKCSSVGHWHLDSSGTSCAPRDVLHLAISTWTHLERLAVREMFVTWPLALGLIRYVLRSRRCSSLVHWCLDSSSTSFAPGNVRHLAIGAWTHPERLALWEMFVTWPLALGLIWNVLSPGRCSSLGRWHLDSSGVPGYVLDEETFKLGYAFSHCGKIFNHAGAA
ncbi:hypothetical protein Tco_1549024 [Tanacetum coccineum]